MSKRTEHFNGSKTDVDKAKRVYRAALESIKCLDNIIKGKKAYREVFQNDAVGLRHKLKEYCERLMFFNPIEYGRKAEEVLWRKVFYEVIQVTKKNKNHIRHHGSVETAYRTHLAAAAGYYQHLVFRLQREFSLKLAGVIDYHLLPDPKTGRRNDTSSTSAVNPSVQEWAQRAIHRCLICLGDISRYICDVDRMEIQTTAERYYHQAFMLFPEIGMPHNQLGTLAGSRYCGCEAVYHYIRCLACEKPFDGAKGNLQRLFERNTKRFYDVNVPQARDLPPDEQRHQDIKRFFCRFLKLLEIFCGTSKNIDMHELQQLCQHTLQDFNLCMFYQPQHKTPGTNGQPEFLAEEEPCDPGDPSSLLYLDNGIVYKIMCSLICTVHLLEKNESNNITAATAFMLALFSHILNHVVIRLQADLDDLENPNKILLAGSSLSLEHQAEESSGSEDEISLKHPQDNSGKPNKNCRTQKPPVRRRRRRRQMSASSEDLSDMSDASDLSEGLDDAETHVLSSESSEDNDLASYFDHGSDSDLSETEEPRMDTAAANNNSKKGPKAETTKKWPPTSQALPNGDIKHLWSNGMEDNSLANISSKLFSSSLMFLGQDLTDNMHAEEGFEQDKDVSIPPGFSSSLEAQHVADITQKLANFEIETDTDNSVLPTDNEQSDFLTDAEEVEVDTENNPSEKSERPDLEQQRLQQTLQVIQAEGLLPTLKVTFNWMRCQSSIISVCSQSSHSLWQRISVLLNFLPHENILGQHELCWSPELQTITSRTRFSDWSQVFPLAEDIEMCQLPSLQDIHSQIDFTCRHRAQLCSMQETILRVCCLRRFGYFLTSMDNIEFSYQPESAMFFGPSTDANPQGNTEDKMAKLRDTESRRNQLMRDMAQLRLQAEVNELEGSLKTSDVAVFPPYVVVDAAALCGSLAKVKDLTTTARCIVVIPLAVVDRLDQEKKESSNAREAIRWLETQLRKGNRYIRAQKAKETMPRSQQRFLKKRNREAWYLMEMLNCALYLAQQTGSFTGNQVVAVVTGELKLMANPVHPAIVQAKTAAEREGVTVETVAQFCRKWSSVMQHQSDG